MECFQSLKDIYDTNCKSFPYEYIWEKIDSTLTKYLKVFKDNHLAERVFVCISIIGCKGMVSESSEFTSLYTGTLDRDNIMCVPIVVDDIFNDDIIATIKRKIHVDYLLSIGVKHNQTIKDYIKELYN